MAPPTSALPSVEESIVIDRPAEDVFAFVTTPENDRLWSSTSMIFRRQLRRDLRHLKQVLER
jgi:hypothetical protein